MDNKTHNISGLLERISDIVGFSEKEREEFVSNTLMGLFFNIVTDTQDMVDKTTLEKVRNITQNTNADVESTRTLILAYLKELEENPKGTEIVGYKINELMFSLSEQLRDNLTSGQKQKLLELID